MFRRKCCPFGKSLLQIFSWIEWYSSLKIGKYCINKELLLDQIERGIKIATLLYMWQFCCSSKTYPAPISKNCTFLRILRVLFCGCNIERKIIATYSGLRPRSKENNDYQIRFNDEKTFATLGAIRSTGLTASRGYWPENDGLKIASIQL